jgi:cytochrome b subunit of formate dehydrogenase
VGIAHFGDLAFKQLVINYCSGAEVNMTKGYFRFPECGVYSRILTLLSVISILAFIILLILGYIIVLLPIFTIICIFVNIAIHKVCRDVSTLLKEIEDKWRGE